MVPIPISFSRDKALIYSMDDPAIYGSLVHTLSFAKRQNAA
jgi:predicted helicase